MEWMEKSQNRKVNWSDSKIIENISASLVSCSTTPATAWAVKIEAISCNAVMESGFYVHKQNSKSKQHRTHRINHLFDFEINNPWRHHERILAIISIPNTQRSLYVSASLMLVWIEDNWKIRKRYILLNFN